MKHIKILLIVLVVPLLMAAGIHKFYVSVTEINYAQDKKSVQIVTRLFVDDLELVLRKRYDDHLTLSKSNESKEVDVFLMNYFKDKFQIRINGKLVDYKLIGKEYDTDIVYCYLEIKDVSQINSFEIKNTLLFDGFEDQQNIVKTEINSENKSFIFTIQNDKGMLNFN